MEAYARELHPAKASVMLLNKADLLSPQLRAAWADYFEARGVDFVFWSAKAASERPLNPGAHSLPASPAAGLAKQSWRGAPGDAACSFRAVVEQCLVSVAFGSSTWCTDTMQCLTKRIIRHAGVSRQCPNRLGVPESGLLVGG